MMMRGRAAPWRAAVAQGPAATAGAGIAGALGLLAGPRLGAALWLGWVSVAGLALTRVGERAMVHLVHGWRPMAATQVGQLRRTAAGYGLDLTQTDLYLARTGVVGAAATGRRSLVLRDSLLRAWTSGSLTDPALAAILGHELAHLRHRDQRYALALYWLALPFTALRAFATPLGHRLLSARAWRYGLPVVLVTAVIQSFLAGDAWTVAVLLAVAAAVWVCPPLARHGTVVQELAADRSVARVGPDAGLREVRQVAAQRLPVAQSPR